MRRSIRRRFIYSFRCSFGAATARIVPPKHQLRRQQNCGLFAGVSGPHPHQSRLRLVVLVDFPRQLDSDDVIPFFTYRPCAVAQDGSSKEFAPSGCLGQILEGRVGAMSSESVLLAHASSLD